MRKLAEICLIAVSLVLLAACAREDASPYPSQSWEDVVVGLETRPLRIDAAGMVEFLVIATRGPRRPAHNLLVTLRIDDEGNWHQAIQDGHLGVYRRALPVPDPERDVLSVRIQYDNREGILRFPLAPGTIDGDG